MQECCLGEKCITMHSAVFYFFMLNLNFLPSLFYTVGGIAAIVGSIL